MGGPQARHVLPPPENLDLDSGAPPPTGGIVDLTPEERSILTGIVKGADREEIALALNISPETVDAGVRSALEKLRQLSARRSA